MTVTVFLGPSLPVSEARTILPGAIYRPPAEQGDLLAAVDQDGADLIGLVDGTFHQNLSVWHNEVCYLLSRGVAVFGASSMGALRAAETERFGTVGVGTVFAWYRDGLVTGDDEVALLHGDASTEFRPMSLPLVNVRASLECAVERRRLRRRIAGEVLEAARAVHYRQRQVDTVLSACRLRGVDGSHFAAIEASLTTDLVDVKRDDAVALLRRLRGTLDGTAARPARVSFDFSRSGVFETLYNLDRRLAIGAVQVSLESIRAHAALHSVEFDDVRRAALNREVVSVLGMMLGLRATEEEIAALRTRFLAQRELIEPEHLTTWLRDNGMSEMDLTEYLAQEVVCRRLQRWVATTRSFDRGCRAVLDESRMRGEFARWAQSTAEATTIVSAYADRPEYQAVSTEEPATLAAAHAASTGVAIIGDARRWAEEAGFDGVTDLVEELRRSAVVIDVRARIARQLAAVDRAQTELANSQALQRETAS